MSHSHLRVRFYPAHGEWMCVVQRLGGDGMPTGADVVSANGVTKDAALHAALADTVDPDVQAALHDLEASVAPPGH